MESPLFMDLVHKILRIRSSFCKYISATRPELALACNLSSRPSLGLSKGTISWLVGRKRIRKKKKEDMSEGFLGKMSALYLGLPDGPCTDDKD